MSLQQLKKDELLALANRFEVPVSEENNKQEILAALGESNITYATYKKFFENGEEAAVSFEDRRVLLKMERQNGSFEVYGVLFTKEHPFAIVSEDVAQQIIDDYSGFRLATPAEAKSFYE